MQSKTALLVLPPALVVSALLVAGACQQHEPEYCEDIETMSQCTEAEGCGWSDQESSCVNTCHEIEDMAECVAISRCEWFVDGGTDGSTSGGGGTCTQFFS